jgi:uncharacterized FlaG/YvyC family protein
MAIESVSMSPQVAPAMAESVAVAQQPIAKIADVSAEVRQEKKFVPRDVKVDIDREPLASAKDLETKIASLNEALVSRNQAVAFSVDASTGHDVVKVTNRSTGELIRQMPSLEALKAMQNIDRMMGLIFNHKT